MILKFNEVYQMGYDTYQDVASSFPLFIASVLGHVRRKDLPNRRSINLKRP
jgi:hypothetical protein